ncbi:MAG: hypothetical protein U0002_11745 [Thermoanaerobaculia bacterium]
MKRLSALLGFAATGALAFVAVLGGLAQAPSKPTAGARVEAAPAEFRRGVRPPIVSRKRTLVRIERGLVNHPVSLSALPAIDPRELEQEDLSLEPERQFPVSLEKLEELRKAGEALPPAPGALLYRPLPGGPGPRITRSIESIDASQAIPAGRRTNPPDPTLAVGKRHVVVATNKAFAIYDKNSGALLSGPTLFGAFFASVGCVTPFDPNVLYDEREDRFFIAMDGAGFQYCFGATQTGDPTGDWNTYLIDSVFDENDFFDYPQVGVGNEAIFMGSNTFPADGGQTSQAWAINKQELYSGAPVTVVVHQLGDESTPHPMHLQGWKQGTWLPFGPHFFITNHDYNGRTYSLYAWLNPFGPGGGIFTRLGILDLATPSGVPAAYPNDTEQLGGNPVQSNDWSPLDLDWRNGYLWATTNILCNPGSGPVTCARWARINPWNQTVVESRVLGTNGEWHTFASVGVNHCQDVALGYSKSSATSYIGAYVSTRLRSDPPGRLRPELTCKAGETTFHSFDGVPHRWGDYTEVAVDPNGSDMWYVGEYSKLNLADPTFTATNWAVAVCKVDFRCRAPHGHGGDDDDDEGEDD